MFGTIIADPAWKFDDSKSSMVKTGKGASSHYACLSLAEIAAYLETACLPHTDIPLAACIADHAHLWLWVPNAFVIEGVGAQIARAWGFEPKTLVTWAKGRLDLELKKGAGISTQFERVENVVVPTPKIVHHIGQGSWLRNSTEQVLFCVRGKAPPAVRHLPTWFLEPRTQHSRKPDTIHRWAEQLSPGPRLELFARRQMAGWTCIGGELVDGTIGNPPAK